MAQKYKNSHRIKTKAIKKLQKSTILMNFVHLIHIIPLDFYTLFYKIDLTYFQLHRFAFIYGRIALIFQKPLFFTSFFRNFAEKSTICQERKADSHTKCIRRPPRVRTDATLSMPGQPED